MNKRQAKEYAKLIRMIASHRLAHTDVTANLIGHGDVYTVSVRSLRRWDHVENRINVINVAEVCYNTDAPYYFKRFSSAEKAIREIGKDKLIKQAKKAGLCI